MRNMLLAGFLAAGVLFSLSGLNEARADHGRSGNFGGPSCHYGHSHGQLGYRAAYVPYYGGFAPTVRTTTGGYFPAAVYSFGPQYPRVYQSGFGGGYGVGFGGGYGNLGYPSPYNRTTLPRVQLRIGF